MATLQPPTSLGELEASEHRTTWETGILLLAQVGANVLAGAPTPDAALTPLRMMIPHPQQVVAVQALRVPGGGAIPVVVEATAEPLDEWVEHVPVSYLSVTCSVERRRGSPAQWRVRRHDTGDTLPVNGPNEWRAAVAALAAQP